ncbi:MAG: aminotransferase class III-fold pyridoxal phosphate-dependent enzyme [Pseudomonadota bacterium]
MNEFDLPPPAFTPAELSDIADSLFGIHAQASLLDSERDQNAKLTASGANHYTLKIANAGESRELLELQNAAMGHITKLDDTLQIPRVHRSLNDKAIEYVDGAESSRHATRLLSFVPGTLYSSAQKSSSLRRSLGSFLGRLSGTLQSFSHPCAHRPEFLWNLDNFLDSRSNIDAIADANDRKLVNSIFDQYVQWVEPNLHQLRVAVIHSDANDNNLVVDEANDSVIGIFDFGDLCLARQVNELAVALAYSLMGVDDIAVATRDVVSHYVAEFPLQEIEAEVLFALIEARLAMSVAISAQRAQQFPDNEYLLVSQAPALALLRKLTAMNRDVKICIARAAAGFPAVEQHRAVVDWLTANASDCRPLFLPNLHTRPRIVVSFADGAAGSEYADQPQRYCDWLDAQLAAAGADYAIGLYAEDRTCYKGEQFVVSGSARARTVHLGIDIFIAAGTPLYTPLPGVIHSVQFNPDPYDYGGTVIVEHDAGGVPFYSLHGHLSRGTVDLHNVGDPLSAGDLVGYIGQPNENGGWAPHVHFQIMTTLLGLHGNFDGAAEIDRMDIWQQICPDPNLILQFPPEAFTPTPASPEELSKRRKALLGPSLSVSYRNPLHIVRGEGAWLFDNHGRAFLDCVNNICHVGHCHPHVVAAQADQALTLNTNTRYLHRIILDYAERVGRLFPDPLSMVFFVNSGSEANELALRMARTYTKRRDIIALDWGYHGNTSGLIDVSPYKFARSGGMGAGANTLIAELPDPYRGRVRGHDVSVALEYCQSVQDRIDESMQHGEGPAAMIVESISGCGGQIVYPSDYLQHAFNAVRNVGGVCIADEVQTGFGRVGDAMWAFELQNAIPDIVTMGKPMGNGHPLAAVITTPAIAKAFDNGMEYFNSFGGNPVSCATGMAVLDVIENEDLRSRARTGGNALQRDLREMQRKFPIIGDVRGSGYFLGVELVRDRDTLEPATQEASSTINALREQSVLLSTDGPHDNVLKFKPPMVFGERERAFFVEQLNLAFEKTCS